MSNTRVIIRSDPRVTYPYSRRLVGRVLQCGAFPLSTKRFLLVVVLITVLGSSSIGGPQELRIAADIDTSGTIPFLRTTGNL